MRSKVVESGVTPGDFPFPISDGPQESRYLTWIRNHSNYMAVRGLLDYIRAVAVLARGALVNAMVGLPLLLLIAISVAAAYVLQGKPAFYVTPWILVIAMLAVAFVYPYGASLMKISGFRRSLGTGTDSSVKLRDHRERRFGAILILILAVAAFEALPVFLDTFHFWAHEREFKWGQLASVIGVVVAVYGVYDKLLSVLGGVARKVAVLVIGALGLLAPLLVVLFVADYLVFSRPGWAHLEFGVVAAFLLPLGILLVLVVGSLRRAFSWKDRVWLSGLLLASAGFVYLTYSADDFYKASWFKAENALNLEIDEIKKRDQPTYQAELDKLTLFAANKPVAELRTLQEQIGAQAGLLGEAYEQECEAAEKFGTLQEKADEVVPLPGGEQPGPIDPPAGKRALLQRQLAALTQCASSAGLEAVLRLTRAVDEAVGRNAWPTVGAQALWKKPGRGEKLTADEENALWAEIWKLHSIVGETTGLLNRQDPKELVDFVLEGYIGADRYLYQFDDKHNRVDFTLLRSKFKDLFEAAADELWDWDGLVYEARQAIYASASPKSFPLISKAIEEFRFQAVLPKAILVIVVAILLWFFCWFTVDINLTSIHGLYRDRLAAAFLIGADTKGDVDIEEDLDLGDLCRHEAGSTAPYHLINVALNLQGSRDIGVRDRQSDFFIFSKRFIGGRRTGYCRSETMERVFPQMSLSTAMAISAAAASPNMGSATSPALVALMTLLNVRLGIWVPNPGRLQDEREPHPRNPEGEDGSPRGFSFPEVFREELLEITRRWEQLPGRGQDRALADETRPTVANRLVGIGFSGGGIRSATINLGIAQALHRSGMFDHVDYMSTVSGGGYLGSSISALMRFRTRTETEVAGRVRLRADEASGKLAVEVLPEKLGGLQRLLGRIGQPRLGTRRVRPTGPREYRFEGYAQLDVKDGDRVKAGQRLLRMGTTTARGSGSFGAQFRWRVRPTALLREMLGRLDETGRWVNVSDGGHIENLAGIELLRRRCKYIVIGDGEADPRHRFNGLATLMRQARIDLGIHIEINVDALRLDERHLCSGHWAVGRVHYPGEMEHGYLLYMKSSITGDEDEVIREYRERNPSFPHESTADQMFNEGQFEAYRSLGQHVGEQVLKHRDTSGDSGQARGASFADLERWFTTLGERGQGKVDGRG